MKNLKKLFAMGTVLAMTIIMSISAFAEGETAATPDGTAENPYTNAYADGAVVVSAIKDALPAMAEGAQYTVVVVPTDEEITDSNIYYINQADGADDVWATTTTWGTPVTLADGTYVVRVGDEAGNVDETYFRIGEEEIPGPTVILGDIVGVTAGEINSDDVFACLQISLELETWTEEQNLAADVVGTTDGEINSDDVFAILQKSLNLDVTFKK